MSKKTAAIIVDTGFNGDVLASAREILGVYDLSSGKAVALSEDGSRQTILADFAGDPLNHGSLVLAALNEIAPDLPVVLVRAYSDQVELIRTGWSEGRISRPGWTEAYLWAVDLCRSLGYGSVANCSFGSFTHAMDGSGWESHSLAQVTGPGKPGHIVVAGAGAGDGRPMHASWCLSPGAGIDVGAEQREPTIYNLWGSVPADTDEGVDFAVDVFLDGRHIETRTGRELSGNIWNGRQQWTFRVSGRGQVQIRTRRFGMASEPIRFNCWINHRDDAFFLDHIDPTVIAEPAVFPHVIAVGLKAGSYSPDQTDEGAKPDALLDGPGPISFRLPEVVAEVAAWLSDDPSLDVDAVRTRLGKFPVLNHQS